MKLKTLLYYLLYFSTIGVTSQNATITSFQHTFKRIDVRVFPNYILNKSLQDTILSATSEALKKKFELKEVILPKEINYKFYDILSKPKLKNPDKSQNPNDYNISILSSFRGTSEFRVFWDLEIEVQQKEITLYSNKTNHELEYFSPSNIYATFAWWDEPEFKKLFISLFTELIDNKVTLPQKIVIGGSQENIEKTIYQLIPNAEKMMLITSGSFLSESDFAISIEKDKVIQSLMIYKKGKCTSKGKLLNGLGASIFASFTGIPSSYDDKTKETKQGKFEFSNSETHSLIMKWEQTAKHNVMSDNEINDLLFSSPEYIKEHTPLNISIINNDSIYGNLTYLNDAGTYYVDGDINKIPIHVIYDPNIGLIRVFENNISKVIVEMHNENAHNTGFFAGSRILKNKDIDISNDKKFKNPEWYTIYLEPNINEKVFLSYMEAIYSLFFAIGHGI